MRTASKNRSSLGMAAAAFAAAVGLGLGCSDDSNGSGGGAADGTGTHCEPGQEGCPCVEPTSPYMKYKYGMEVGPGRRVAMEIKRAVAENKLGMIVT